MPARLRQYLEQRIGEMASIAEQRQAELRVLANYINDRLIINAPAKLVFICTHNSRRSQMAQIWAQVAAEYFQIRGVSAFSGGTEVTAFNPRAVAALVRAGLKLGTDGVPAMNPVYRVDWNQTCEPISCFSKRFDDAANPGSEYCAVMTCSHADENCPLVPGCERRIAIRYADPKEADDTPNETARYDQRAVQICTDMLYVMKSVSQSIPPCQ